MGSSIVFVLVMIGYNAMSHNVDSAREVAWTMSHSACLQELSYQNQRGRAEGYNHEYVCLRVSDFEARARIERSHDSHVGYNVIRSRHALGRGGFRVEW